MCQTLIKNLSKNCHLSADDIYRAIFSDMRFFLRSRVETDIHNSSAISIIAHSRRRNGIISSSSSEKPQCSKNNSHSSTKNLYFNYLPPEQQNSTLNTHSNINKTMTMRCRLTLTVNSLTVCQPNECLDFFMIYSFSSFFT